MQTYNNAEDESCQDIQNRNLESIFREEVEEEEDSENMVMVSEAEGGEEQLTIQSPSTSFYRVRDDDNGLKISVSPSIPRPASTI